jgi:hypothetical protein
MDRQRVRRDEPDAHDHDLSRAARTQALSLFHCLPERQSRLGQEQPDAG